MIYYTVCVKVLMILRLGIAKDRCLSNESLLDKKGILKLHQFQDVTVKKES